MRNQILEELSDYIVVKLPILDRIHLAGRDVFFVVQGLRAFTFIAIDVDNVVKSFLQWFYHLFVEIAKEVGLVAHSQLEVLLLCAVGFQVLPWKSLPI